MIESLAAERLNPRADLFKCQLCRCMWSERRPAREGDIVGRVQERGQEEAGQLASPDGVSPYRRT